MAVQESLERKIGSAELDKMNRAKKVNEMLVETVEQAGIEEQYQVRGAVMADLTPLVEMLNVCAVHIDGKPEVDENMIKADWLSPDWTLAESTRVVLNEAGDLVGYIEVWDNSDLPAVIWCWGRVHPEYEGAGIGTYLLEWAFKRASLAIPRAPADAQVSLRIGVSGRHRAGIQLAESLGMQAQRRFWDMEIELDREIPEPVFPEGLEIRTFAETQDLVQLYRAVNDAFRDHWGFLERPEEEQLAHWRHWLANDEKHDPNIWYLVMDGDEIAAMALCRPDTVGDPEKGHVNTLGVRRPWRRQGVALNLLHYTFREFQKRGQKRVDLGVDATSLTGAEKLYVKAGMRQVKEGINYEYVLRPGRDLTTKSVQP